MIRSYIAIFLLWTAFPIIAGNINITPLPVSVTEGKGEFIVTAGTGLFIDAAPKDTERLKKAALSDFPQLQYRTTNSSAPSIKLIVNPDFNLTDSGEGYRLNVDPKGVVIEAREAAGLFYGLQTLGQLADGTDRIPAVEILDFPRMEYRGLMLDISRHFRGKDFIKKQIDAIAKLKINNLHLHLTDAAGWRIEIEKYPELTQYAAWRPQETWKEWNDGGNRYIDGDNPFAHGGYLSKDDAREIVEYAADHYITVIPEIEMPSHSEEVTATFPMLSCDGERQPDVCVGNEKTFEFFQNVLDEIMEIFPSEYIHIGGDEASKQAWLQCELCRARMEEEGLSNVDELQSYMIERIEKYINSKGRKIIGWDEIMDGGLAPNAVVMSWRGTEGGIKAAHSGHEAIMTPGGYCYLDSYQDAPATQPEAISGYLPLQKVYSYNPVPDTLETSVKPFIKGIQGNLWCEYIPTAQHAEYMLYPRMIAIAEIGWTPQSRREWDDFYSRALKVNDNLQRDGYHVFDLKGEVGDRREALLEAVHLGRGKKVTYNVPWWSRYNANFDQTLTDGVRGSWTYGDGRWQGFLYRGDQRLDVTIDLEQITDISYIGADFMQITGPGVWLPATVIISVSDDGEHFRDLATIEHEQRDTSGLSFKMFAWEGKDKARYVRYVARSAEGCLFTDEIIIR